MKVFTLAVFSERSSEIFTKKLAQSCSEAGWFASGDWSFAILINRRLAIEYVPRSNLVPNR